MKVKIHELKIVPDYFKEVKEGNKNFEIRFNDRNYQKGDVLRLREHEYVGSIYTNNKWGDELYAIVTYVLADAEHEYLRDGYVCLGIRILKDFNLKENNNAQ